MTGSGLRLPNAGSRRLSQKVRSPGIEPGPSAWKADILTTELRALLDGISQAETS